MKKMAAGVFKANCLAVMDDVQAKRETVVITKHGKPVAKLVPINMDKDEIFGFLAGKGAVTGDIVSPALTPEEWGDSIDSCRHTCGRLARLRPKPDFQEGKSHH
jgi:prevent-host-death family protein